MRARFKAIAAYVLCLWRIYLPRLPKVLFAFSVMLAVFAYGYQTSERDWFPKRIITESISFYHNLKFQLWGYRKYGIVRTNEVLPSAVERSRVVGLSPSGGAEKLLISGGAGQFLEYCPRHGCLAVILTRQGRLVQAVPLLPDEFKKKPFVDFAYDRIWHNPERDIQAGSVFRLPSGDFIFNIEDRGVYPYGGGIARLRPNGKIVWYRRDYAHHWSTQAADGSILSPSRNGVRDDVEESVPLVSGQAECRAIRPDIDLLEVVDKHGRMVRELPLLSAMRSSRFRGVLSEAFDPCDVLHMNFVHEVGPALAVRWKGVSPRDYLISFRHLSAFIVLDANDGHVEQLVRGSFVRQHSVQPLPDGRIVMFDNEGIGGHNRASRVLILDPKDWSEQTLFPTPQTPVSMDTYSSTGGYIDVSRDGKRLWVSIAEKGISYEIEIATGHVLTIYNNYHLGSAQHAKPGEVRRMIISQVQYIN